MIAAFLREQFEAEMSLTADVLRAVPTSGLDWKPHPQSFSLGRLAMHVAAVPGWVAAFATGDAYDMGVGGSGPAMPSSREDVLGKFADASHRGRRILESFDDAALLTPWSLLRDGATVAVMTRGEAIARYVIRHVVHHRGQLTVYLRLRNLVVPPVYGDSADRRLLPPDRTS